MELREPMMITPSLMAGVEIAKGEWVGIEETDRCDRYGKPYWKWQILTDEFEEEGADLRGWGDEREMMRALLSFLEAAAEAYRSGMRGYKSDNADLFSPQVMEWAYGREDEIGMLRLELEEERG